MNNKGITLVELVATFALSSVIIVLLLNIIFLIKNIYLETNLKTELYINQSNLSNVLNKKLNESQILNAVPNQTQNAVDFNLNDGTSFSLEVINNKIIKFGNYVYKVPENVTIGNPIITKSTYESPICERCNFFVLKIPISCDLYPNIDFGINLVYLNN